MESLSRISSLLETARDLTLEAAQSASAAGRISHKDGKYGTPAETKNLLNSRMEREVLDGLRRVIAVCSLNLFIKLNLSRGNFTKTPLSVKMMSRGVDCSEFFADVVKNVAAPSLEIKKLVYIYLLRYAESEPDLALLSINTIQKALNDQNQVVRAMAIRVMSGIRVPVISQIVALGIKRCVTDMSAYVRKSAALAIPKCYRLDPTTLPQLTECMGTLLGDRSFYVVGAAVMGYLEVCPEKWELIHSHYRGLVKMLIDMDEWGQLAVLRLLTEYARSNFPLKRKAKANKASRRGAKEAFYSDQSEGEDTDKDKVGMVAVVDPDLELLLKACEPLLQSRNSAVIVAVARAYRHLAPPDYLPVISGPLVSLVRGPVDVQHMALVNIVAIALQNPQPFAKYPTHFLVHATDPPHIWRLKLELLTLIFQYTNAHTKNLILSELEYFAQGHSKDLVQEAVRAIGRCAQSQTKNAARCFRLLLRQVESSDGTLVAESLTAIRHIIQQNPNAHSKTVIRLAKALDTASNPSARASIIWLVGEFAGMNGGNNVAADTLRLLAKGFAGESEQAKLQIVLLAAKVYAHHLNTTQSGTMPIEGVGEAVEEEEEEKHPVALLFSYIMLLARYDLSYDLRDRARLYKSILSVPSSTQLATLLLLAPKPTPQAPSPSSGREDFTIGSAAIVLGKEEDVMGYKPLSEWVTVSRAPSPSLREPPAGSGSGSGNETPRSGGNMGIIIKGAGGRTAGASPMVGSPRLGGSPNVGSPRWQDFREPAKAQKKDEKQEMDDFYASEEDGDDGEDDEETDEDDDEDDDDDDEDEEDEEDNESGEESEDGGGEGSKLLGGEK